MSSPCPIVQNNLTREWRPPIASERKCYKCGRVYGLDKFPVSPSPNVLNGGKTWACASCMGEDLLNYLNFEVVVQEV